MTVLSNCSLICLQHKYLTLANDNVNFRCTNLRSQFYLILVHKVINDYLIIFSISVIYYSLKIIELPIRFVLSSFFKYFHVISYLYKDIFICSMNFLDVSRCGNRHCGVTVMRKRCRALVNRVFILLLGVKRSFLPRSSPFRRRARNLD